jgi:hypothetical protein
MDCLMNFLTGICDPPKLVRQAYQRELILARQMQVEARIKYACHN